MNNITEEQRKRMEENRRKALEKRAAATRALEASKSTIGTQGGFPSSSTSSSSLYGQKTTIAQQPNQYSVNPLHKENHQNVFTNVQNVGVQPAKPMNQFNPTFSTTNSGLTFQKPFTGKTIAGTCRMISKDRFVVEVGYQQQLVAIIKSIKGAQYDTQRKIWSLPLSEHQNLMPSVEPLKPAVCLGQLPAYVLKIFRAANQPQKVVSDSELNCIDPTLNAALMPFQREGVKFGISKEGRVLIADDMGLGKTIQALGIAHYYVKEWPLLIATPSSMRYAWREAIWKWLPSIQAGSIAVMESGKDTFHSAKVVIFSYDLLQKRAEELANIKFKVVIMDESHNLKNYKTARTRAATPIIQNAKRAILLSGTPALSRPIELFPQIFSLTKFLFNLQEFGIRYCAGKKNSWGWDYSGSSNMEELQLILEASIMIRRLKSDVLTQLPNKFRKVVALDPAQIKLTSANLRAKANAFQEGKHLKSMEARGRLLEYYAETSKVKLPAVSAYLKDLIESGKKLICFAHHRSMLDGLSQTLEEIKCKYIRIDGSTSPEDRQYAVEQFQSSDEILVAVLSITAANSGLTLTAASLVVFAELYWNPGILTQAEDRAHRIGQRDSVVVEYLIAKGTADDVLWPMVQEKINVLNKAGLSKDNFNDVDSSSFTMPAVSSTTKGIDKYFQAVAVPPKLDSATSSVDLFDTSTDPESSMIMDEDLLLQLIDDSFGE